MLVIRSQTKQADSLGALVVQRLVSKEGSPRQKWAEVLRKSMLSFRSSGWILWLEVSKDHKGVKCYAFGNEAPKSIVVWLKMPV